MRVTTAKGQKLAGASFIEGSPSEATAAAGLEATGGGGTGQPVSAPEFEAGISSAELDRAEARVDALMIAALRALAAPSDEAGHLSALASLRACVAGRQDLATAAARHHRPEPTITPVRPPWTPDPTLAAAAAAVLAKLED